MSLDVYLKIDQEFRGKTRIPKIFIRENGRNLELTRKEWDDRFPGVEPLTCEVDESDNEVFSYNITHNLGLIAGKAGCYEALWRPDEIGITHAAQLIEPLEKGLDELLRDPDHYKQFNPKNGWGDYEGLVVFIKKYLEACKKYPEAQVTACR